MRGSLVTASPVAPIVLTPSLVRPA
jgi:hypothetical protein